RLTTRNTTSRTRNTLKHSSRDPDGTRSKRKPGKNKASQHPTPRLNDLDAFGRSSFGVKIAQAFCHGAYVAIANLAIVQLGDRSQFAHGTGAENFTGTVNIDKG